MKKKILMICAPARSGKDTLFPHMKSVCEIKYGGFWKKWSFADTIKRDLEKTIWEKYEVSVWDDSKKSIFRGDLINYGLQKRDETNGKYLLNDLIDDAKNTSDNFIITDFRFVDEYYNLKNELIDYEITPIYIVRILKKDELVFKSYPIIPSEVKEYSKIEPICKRIDIPWVDSEMQFDLFRFYFSSYL